MILKAGVFTFNSHWFKGFRKPLVLPQKSLRKPLVPILKAFQKLQGLTMFRRFLIKFPVVSESIISVPDSKSRNIPEVVIVRRWAVGVLGIWKGWDSWVKGGANRVSLQAT